MSEFLDDGVSRENIKKFEVEKFPVSDGVIYEVYFPSEEAATQAVIDFWNNRPDTAQATIEGLKRGMLKGNIHQITSGDRSHPMRLTSGDNQKHPGMAFKVQFNGNTNGLSQKGEIALKKLGYIE